MAHFEHVYSETKKHLSICKGNHDLAAVTGSSKSRQTDDYWKDIIRCVKVDLFSINNFVW